jgi:TrwC relaxase
LWSNGPKSWSLAAALHPDVAAAYDAAHDRGAEQIIGWLAEHTTTRVGPRGGQMQVPIEVLEAVTVRHYYASVLLAAGESVVAVAERLGREDASLVLSTYGHLMPDSDDRTRSAIDAARDAASASCAPDVPQGAQPVR